MALRIAFLLHVADPHLIESWIRCLAALARTKEFTGKLYKKWRKLNKWFIPRFMKLL